MFRLLFKVVLTCALLPKLRAVMLSSARAQTALPAFLVTVAKTALLVTPVLTVTLATSLKITSAVFRARLLPPVPFPTDVLSVNATVIMIPQLPLVALGTYVRALSATAVLPVNLVNQDTSELAPTHPPLLPATIVLTSAPNVPLHALLIYALVTETLIPPTIVHFVDLVMF